MRCYGVLRNIQYNGNLWYTTVPLIIALQSTTASAVCCRATVDLGYDYVGEMILDDRNGSRNVDRYSHPHAHGPTSSFPEEPLVLAHWLFRRSAQPDTSQWRMVNCTQVRVGVPDPPAGLLWTPRIQMSYEVLKTFTSTATEDPATAEDLELLLECPLSNLGAGCQICMVLQPLGDSVESLRLSGGNASGGFRPEICS